MFIVFLFFVHGFAVGSQLPRITEHPVDLTLPRHEPGTLGCAVEGDGVIQWYKDGLPLEPSAGRVLLPAGSLLFLRVGPRDVGVYWCSATNEAGVVNSRNATLQVGVLKEEFRVEPSNQRAAQGDTVLLECAPPRGSPEPAVYWNKDGHSLDISIFDRIEIVDGGNLVIRNVRKNDEGSYQCIAKNAAGIRESAAAELQVHVRPFLLHGPEDTVVVEGTSVVFRCEAGGDPAPTVLWVRTDGYMAQDRARVDGQSLQLDAVTPEDEGVYTCEIDNDVGGLSAAATLTVLAPPVITVRPVELTVDEGHDAIFSCGVKGKPLPTVFWILEMNHTLLLPGSEVGRFGASSIEGGYMTLTVKKVKQDDDGLMVMCGAVNSVGSDSWFARLSVAPADHPPPIIQLGPTNQTLPLHTPATMICQAVGEPTPVVLWYKDGIPVSPDSTRSISEDNTLVINDLVKSDEGLYTCVASSRTGKAAWSAHLHLEPRTNPNAVFFRSPEPITLPGAPSPPVMVDSTGSSITISWTRNNKIGASSLLGYQVEMFSRSLTGWMTVARRVPSTSYTQNNLQANVTYKFVVRAENSHGLSAASPPSPAFSLSSSHSDVRVQEARASLSAGHAVDITDVQIVSSTSVKLIWEILSGDHVEGVLIYSEDLKHNITTSVSVFHSGDTSGYLVTGLRPNTRYQLFLVPFYKTVAGRPSKSATVTTLEDVPSEPPCNMEAVLINRSSVQLKWKPPPRGRNGILTSYQLIVRVGDSMNNVTVDATNPSLLLTNLTTGVVYTIQAAACTGLGAGPYSDPASLILDPSSIFPGHFGQPIRMKPSVEMTEPDVLSEAWFTALLSSMVAVMFLFFTAMLYVWRKQMIDDKGFVPESQSNRGVVGFQAMKVGHPNTDLWIDKNMSSVKVYAEDNVEPRQYEDASAAYAYTTLVLPRTTRNVNKVSDYDAGSKHQGLHNSFGFYERKVYSENYNYNCISEKEYTKLTGNASSMIDTYTSTRGRTKSDFERGMENGQINTTPSPRNYQVMNNMTQNIRQKKYSDSSSVTNSPRFYASTVKSFSTFSNQNHDCYHNHNKYRNQNLNQNQSHNHANNCHHSTFSEPR